MPNWLYDAGPNGHWVFLLVTVVMGGLTAWATGRAIAATWRSPWQIISYGMLIALAVRFLHYALFHEPLLSLRNLAVDYVVVAAAALTGYLVARRRQMRDRYSWMR